MSRLATNDEETNSLNLIYIKVKGEAKWEISMTDIAINIGIDQIAEMEESSLAVKFSMDKIILVDQGMNKATGITLGEGISEIMQEHIKISVLGDRIIEVDTEEITGMKIMKEVGVGLEKDHIQVIT